MKMIALAFLAVSLAAPAIAADSNAVQKPKKPHMICKRDDDTGSRMSKVICKTADEWAGRNAVEGASKIGVVAHGQAGGSGVMSTGN
jgi:opacity protein-like surface antigen